VAARSKARKRAVDLLYEADVRGVDVHLLVAAARARPTEYDVPALTEETVGLVEGVTLRRRRIDAIVTAHARDWTLDRMPAVDRNVLRLGVFELLYRADVPTAVAISEAVELVSSLSTDESPRFVNGLLSAVAGHREALLAQDAQDAQDVQDAQRGGDAQASGVDLDGAPGLRGEDAPADELVGQRDGGGVVDDGEGAQILGPDREDLAVVVAPLALDGGGVAR